MDHTVIDYNTMGGISIYSSAYPDSANSKLDISNSIIRNNDWVGISIGSPCTFSLHDSMIYNNHGLGIDVSSRFAPIDARNTWWAPFRVPNRMAPVTPSRTIWTVSAA
jgi:hypothetical protein